MAEWGYALASVAELKAVVGIASSDTGQDAVLEDVLRRTSETIEAHLGRQIVSRGALTEYHSVNCSTVLHLLDWPIISITTIKEGAWAAGTWTAAGVALTASDYLAHSSSTGARLIRIVGQSPAYWYAGFDSVQVVYAAGYATTSVVPGPIKDVCLSVAARKYGQIRRGGDFGAQTTTDAMGSVSRFLPAELLSLDQQQLYPWRQLAQSTTGRR